MKRLFLLLLLVGCSSGPSRQEMLKAFDDGCKALDRFDYVQAVSSFDKSSGLSEELGDLQYYATSNEKLGEIFYGVFDPEASIPYFEVANEAFLQANDTLAALESHFHKGQALYQSGKIEESREVLEQVHSQWQPGGEKQSELDCSLAMAYLGLSPLLAPEAVLLFENADRIASINDIEYLSAYAYALKVVGQEAESRKKFAALEAMGASGFHPYLFWKAKAAETEGNFTEAYSLLRTSEETSRTFNSYRNFVSEAHGRFLSMEARLAKEQAKSTRRKASIIVICLLVLIGSLVSIFYRKWKDSENEKKRLNIILESLKDKEKTMSRNYFEVVGGIMEQYAWGHKRGNSEEKVLSFLDSFVANVSGEGKRSDSFESIVDNHFDGVINSFRKDFPKLSEDKYRLFCYSVAGFDSTTIALIMDVSVKAVYMRRMRLRKMIAASTCAQKESYLNLIDSSSR